MNDQFMCHPEYQPTMFPYNTPFPTEQMVTAMLQNVLNRISHKNLTLERYKTALKVFKAIQAALTNPQTPRPSKDELRTALDVLCEIKKESAMTQAQKDGIEAETEWYKLLLEWLMPD